MKFWNFSFFNFLIIISNALKYSLANSKMKNSNNLNWQNLTRNPRKLDTICNIKNCLSCDNRNECIKCKDGYELSHKRCYTKNCDIYGFCRFCDEYDCLKCLKGYKLNYGICNIKEPKRKKFYLEAIIIFLIIVAIIYLIFYYRKVLRERISTGKVIKFLHPKSGFYKLNFETNDGPIGDISNNKILSTQQTEYNMEKASPVVNCCVECGNKNTYCISECGCSLCLEHYKMVKEGKNIKCRVHKTIIASKISFVMMEKSKIKGNALEKLGLPKCPICKINDGTQSFNCGCPMRVCEKCFNDNVYVLKYNQCPGCGKEYYPIKNVKKSKKNSEEEAIKNH